MTTFNHVFYLKGTKEASLLQKRWFILSHLLIICSSSGMLNWLCSNTLNSTKRQNSYKPSKQCYSLLRKWKGGKTGIQHCTLLKYTLFMNTNSKSSMIHTLKSSFETYKNALKNMYIDIFICIQIGPSEQQQTYYSYVWVFPKEDFYIK